MVVQNYSIMCEKPNLQNKLVNGRVLIPDDFLKCRLSDMTAKHGHKCFDELSKEAGSMRVCET